MSIPTQQYIGLMSGTSLDGVDAVLAQRSVRGFRVLASTHLDMPASLRQRLLALNTSGPDELHQAQLAANELVQLYARASGEVLDCAGLRPDAVTAIGAHGQTVRHQPPVPGTLPDTVTPWTAYTLQLNNPALLAELTGITVVADFRSRDVAAGGQGAPLVPAFHQAVFAQPGETVAVVNIGGMANVSILPPDGAITGFDTGPGNVLMDGWCERHRGKRYDAGGTWAASGHVHAQALAALQADPYFRLNGPRSTGREQFNLVWLDRVLDSLHIPLIPADVQATLAELTAWSIAQTLPSGVTHLAVCGGGALNAHLMMRLALQVPGLRVLTTAEWGLPPLDVEAAAFAWLAEQAVARQPGNVRAVTGAAGPRILGAIYPV